ncbi:carboxymuconolactone decarboxylase family protein [Methanolobus chelungpuianus]|uniref:carboxymuconolactone decarboxylase family protein n=1 Tax=Methanolobus chelungpuianus TaxID=502115 RepID=UPI002115443A
MKTGELAYIAVLATLRLESGIFFHVKHARMLGASLDEVINAILIGLPAAGNAVIKSIFFQQYYFVTPVKVSAIFSSN